MATTKANKLEGKWRDAKIQICEWLEMSMRELPPAKKASDCLDIIKAYKLVSDMVGKGRPDDDDYKIEQPNLERASNEISRAIGRGTAKIEDIFGGKEDEDED